MKKITILPILCIFLTGCWDQMMLKETRLAVGIGYDQHGDDELLQTVDIEVPRSDSSGTGRPAFTSIILKSTGATPRQTRTEVEQEVAGNYAPNKVLVFLLGEDLAKKDIYPLFDKLYRYPRSSLGAKVALVKGRAEDIFALKKVEEKLISPALLQTIESAEVDTYIPQTSIQSICPILLDDGHDFGLPIIKKSDNHQLMAAGMALFHGQKYTGVDLNEEETSTLLLLNRDEKQLTRLNFKVNPEEKRKIYQYISVNVFLKKHDLKIKINKANQVTADLKLNLHLHVIEYPLDNLNSKEVQKMEKKIKQEFAEKAKHVISELQRANCDYFGIGKWIKAYYPKAWAAMDWTQVYPTIEINPQIQIEIVETGIIR
ncbi:Ger(x)C family spore germination protein [Pseudoneobacillus sp. C159]